MAEDGCLGIVVVVNKRTASALPEVGIASKLSTKQTVCSAGQVHLQAQGVKGLENLRGFACWS